jgi:hypothetical protein
MNYTKIYNQLIERAKNRKPERDGYYERHHIIPKCMGGSNDKDNLVKLTYREHFIAHWLLHRANPTNKPLAASFIIMAFGKNRGRAIKERGNKWIPSSRQLEEARIATVGMPLSEKTKQKLREAKQKMSEETKQKIREAHLGNTYSLGNIHSEETKQKMREASLGNIHSDETKKKMSESALKMSKETKQKMSEARLGKKHSEETKQKVREASLGNTHRKGSKMSEETKQKMSEAKLGNTSMLGKKHSEETKQKMREAKLGRTHITNGNEIKAINPNEELPIGWRYGRKKFNIINNKKWW